MIFTFIIIQLSLLAMRSQSPRIMNKFSSKQKLIRRYEMRKNPWGLIISLCLFEKWVEGRESEKCERYRIRIKVEFDKDEEVHLVKKGLRLHSRNISPYIQTYYEIFELKEDATIVSIEAQIYKYTLAELLTFCKHFRKKIPVSFFRFLITSYFEMYKYILYILEMNKGASFIEKLRYDATLDNVGVNSDYRLILLNPCISQTVRLEPLMDKEGFIGNEFRNQMKGALKQVKEFLDSSDLQDHGFLSFLSSDKEEKRKIDKEQKMINFWQGYLGKAVIDEKLYLFMREDVETNIAGKKDLLKSSVLVDYFESEEKRSKDMLRSTISET